jgi:hypothetical protein
MKVAGFIQFWRLQRNLLRHEAADREAEHIDLLQPERLDERNGICAHFLEGGRYNPIVKATRSGESTV